MKKWPSVLLESVCTKIQDGAHRSPKVLYSEPGIGRFPYITSTNIRTGYLRLDSIQYCDEAFHNEIYPRCNVELGDVLLTKDGANTGNVAINTFGQPFSLLSSVCLLKTNADKLLARFLFYYLQSEEGLAQITGQMTGAAIKRIILKTIKKSSLPLPPLPEQRRIVGILDEAFAGLATAEANAARNLQNAREIFDSHLQAVFSQRGQGWVERRLEEIGRTQTGSTPKTSNQSNYGNFIPFVKPSHFNPNGSLDYEQEGLSATGLASARVVPAGSVLMVCIGATIGKCGYCDQDITTNQQINALIPADGSSHRFLYYQMLTENFQRSVIHGSGQATLPIINKAKWSTLTVSLPPTVAEQKRIAAQLDALAAETQRLERLYEQKQVELAALKKSLLHEAFSGML